MRRATRAWAASISRRSHAACTGATSPPCTLAPFSPSQGPAPSFPYISPHISPISPRRDLASFQLATFPDMTDAPIRTHYAAHPWSEDTPRRLEVSREGGGRSAPHPSPLTPVRHPALAPHPRPHPHPYPHPHSHPSPSPSPLTLIPSLALTLTLTLALNPQPNANPHPHPHPHPNPNPNPNPSPSPSPNPNPNPTEAWRKGLTGYPMVDAGMRCLYATGCVATRPSYHRCP